jgi:hypothetical protein
MLASTATKFSGAPYDTGPVSAGALGLWWLQVFTDNKLIGSVAPTLLDANGHLLPDIIEDIFLVCRYAAG